MLITLDLTEPMVANSALDATIYSQTKTELTFTVQNPQGADLEGFSCVLLSTDGKTLAHSIISSNKAVLDTNTVECIEYVSSLQVDAKTAGYLVIGEAESIKAVVPVDVARNFISDVAPPSSVAGMYPTSDKLKEILTQMTAQADRAEEAVEATEKAQKAVADYVDVTFPAKVEDANKTIAKAVTDGMSVITQTANQANGAISSHTSTIVTALNQKQTQIEASIDTKAQAVNSALETKVTEANTALDTKVTEANQAKTDAVKARGEAEGFKKDAEGFAKDASTSASNAKTSEDNAKASADELKASADTLNEIKANHAPKFVKYISGQYDYIFKEIKVSWIKFDHSCHDGWMIYSHYSPYQRWHLSSSGKLTEIGRGLSASANVAKATILDVINKVTYQYETQSGSHYLTTISGVGDDVTISRVQINALPTEEMASYSNIVGWILENGFIVCTNGKILKSDLTETGTTFNCASTGLLRTRLIKVGTNKVKYLDSSTYKITIMTLDENGTPSFSINTYPQTAPTGTIAYAMLLSGYGAFKINKGLISLNDGVVGYFYSTHQYIIPYKFYGCTTNGIVCNGKDLFGIIPSGNDEDNAVYQLSFGLVDSFTRKNTLAYLYEDGIGNFAVFENPVTIYEENRQYVYVFRKKEV